jgi:hypothetical protein
MRDDPQAAGASARWLRMKGVENEIEEDVMDCRRRMNDKMEDDEQANSGLEASASAK